MLLSLSLTSLAESATRQYTTATIIPEEIF
jgi:hypothetical protein